MTSSAYGETHAEGTSAGTLKMDVRWQEQVVHYARRHPENLGPVYASDENCGSQALSRTNGTKRRRKCQEEKCAIQYAYAVVQATIAGRAILVHVVKIYHR